MIEVVHDWDSERAAKRELKRKRCRLDRAKQHAIGMLGGSCATLRTFVPAWDPGDITSKTINFWYRADLGVTEAGTGVSAWADQGGGGRNASQGTDSARPTLLSSAIDSKPAIQSNGTSDWLDVAWDPPVPSTTNIWIWCIYRLDTWTSGRKLCSGNGSALGIRCLTSTPGISLLNNTSGPLNSAGTIGSFFRLIASYTGSTSDRLKIGSTNVTGTNVGVVDASGFSLFARDGGSADWGAFTIAEFLCTAGEPSSGELSSLESYGAARYPSAGF